MKGLNILKISKVLLTSQLLIWLLPFSVAKAAGVLTDIGITTTDKPITQTSYLISFKTATADTLKRIEFYFYKDQDDPYKPAHLNLSSASLSNVTGLTWGSWDMNATQIANGEISLNYDTGQNFNAGDSISVTFASITTPELGDCSISDMIYDQCWIDIKTYSDGGTTLVDSGGTSYEIADEPSLTFNLSGVAGGTQTNGVTTTLGSDPDNIDFTTLTIFKPEYVAQRLFAKTTAPHGYAITMQLEGGILQGIDPNNQITPFLPTNGAWVSPQEWKSPQGLPNSDSGWIGANTTDGRIDQDLNIQNIWSNGNGYARFGPVSNTPHLVMTSNNTRDRDGTNAYITYAIEINQNQPPDSYLGTLQYNIVTTY